jgi:hypothetical protein
MPLHLSLLVKVPGTILSALVRSIRKRKSIRVTNEKAVKLLKKRLAMTCDVGRCAHLDRYPSSKAKLPLDDRGQSLLEILGATGSQ